MNLWFIKYILIIATFISNGESYARGIEFSIAQKHIREGKVCSFALGYYPTKNIYTGNIRKEKYIGKRSSMARLPEVSKLV